MIKPEVKDVEAVFVGVALALKHAGKLAEMSFSKCWKNLKLMKVFSDQNMRLLRLSKI